MKLSNIGKNVKSLHNGCLIATMIHSISLIEIDYFQKKPEVCVF